MRVISQLSSLNPVRDLEFQLMLNFQVLDRGCISFEGELVVVETPCPPI